MQTADHLEALRRDVDRFSRVARAGDLTVPVPSCPDWMLADLVWHLVGVHSFWGDIVERRLQDPAEARRPDRPADDAALPDLFDERAARLVHTLTDTDPSTPVWTWAARQEVGFVHRRMAQEIAVHRWDAEDAVGDAAPIEPDLATDGVDEFVHDHMPGGPRVIGRIELATTDTGVRWSIGAGRRANAILSAPASDLLLALWRRVPPEAVEITGDREAAIRFLDRTDLD